MPLEDTLEVVAASAAAHRVLALDGEAPGWLPEGFDVVPQGEGPLDRRLATVFDAVSGPTFLVGMDTPQLDVVTIDGALDVLTSGSDAVLGPAGDGGWWGLGLRHSTGDAVAGVPMSERDTGAHQRRGSVEAGLDVGLLDRLDDVDTWADACAVAELVPGTALRRRGRPARARPRRRSGGRTVIASLPGRTVGAVRRRFTSPLHDERIAGYLGIALGVGFVVCFATGVLSHLIQNPPSWFHWTPRPAGFYRLNQGLHVATGLALIPILFAKLWVVYPKLFAWPPFGSFAQAVERLALLPLIGGGLVLVFTGVANINIFRPWDFGFREGHYAAAWVAVGGLVIHVVAKWSTTVGVVRSSGAADAADPGAPRGGLDRRAFLGTVFGASGVITLFTVGQTFAPLSRLALLSPRRPDVGPQGFPVNRTAESVGLTDIDLDTWRLVVEGRGVSSPLELTYDELRAMPQREAALPIACVEGWSASQTWRGVPVRDLLERAGAPDDAEVTVVSIQESTRLETSDLEVGQVRDADTLLALEVGGETLVADHGFPARLIGPNRPGVQQTKWVGRLEVR
ncbi:MAG: DUF2064 domain-containing protein [Acidimicrobiia bacterium]|nr:DUF2064 domain-containing protein [Acidimicrobiia bacterium]